MRRLLLVLVLLLPATAHADGLDPLNPVVLREYQLFGCASGENAPEWCTTIKATITATGSSVFPQTFTLTFLDPDCPLCGSITNELGTFAVMDNVRLRGADGCTHAAIDSFFACDFAANDDATLTLTWTNNTDTGPYRRWAGTYTTTPEPGTLVMMGTGLLMLVGMVRRLH